MVRQNPRQLITLLNWTRRWSEWKRRISRRVSIEFLLYCVWLLERNGMKSISSRMNRRVELFGEKTMWMWLSVFHLILECLEYGEDWKWNNVSVNVESLYSTLEFVQQGRKEGSVCFCCLLWIIHRDARARWHTDYWFNEADTGLHGGIETVELDEDDWLFVWITAILLETGSDRI